MPPHKTIPKLGSTADEKLHNTIFAMVQNERAERTIRNLNDQWHRLQIGFAAMQSRMTTSIDEHKLIVISILDGDADAADQAMQDHLNRVRDDLARMLENLSCHLLKMECNILICSFTPYLAF